MDYFAIYVGGDFNDQSLAVVYDSPKGVGLEDYRLVLGQSAKSVYPENAEIWLREDQSQKQLASVVGNTVGFFLVDEQAKEIIRKFDPDALIEYLPVTICDHTGKSLSSQYWIINPLKAVDCLNTEASEATFSEKGKLETVKQIVLDPTEIDGSQHLFRIENYATELLISRELAETMKKAGVTNLKGVKVKQERS